MAKKRVYQSPTSWAEVDLATEVAEAKRLFEECLAREGFTHLTARPVLKIKPMKIGIAHYRNGSAITSNPIFWISDKFAEQTQACGLSPDDVLRELFITIGHEYAHALCDLLRYLDWQTKTDTYKEIILESYGDEEEFTEEFGRWLASGTPWKFMTKKANAIKEALA